MASSHELREQIDRVLSDEIGTIYKTASFRCAMLYPSPYRAGMSSLGYQVVYREVNDRPDWVAERAFFPDQPKAFRESRTPLFTYESKFRVSEADVIAVSFAYELEIGGLLESLDLAGVPVRARERSAHDPLVVIGGPLTFSNPVPIGPFADVIVMGEGEELIHTVLDMIEDGHGREELLSRLASVPHLWVPEVHGERLLPVAKVSPDKLPAYSSIITPHTELANMHLVEAERGCHRKCTFCVMRRSTNDGMRLGEVERVLSTIPEEAQRVGLVGAAVSDHPKLKEIVASIVASGRGIGLSSLRADRLDDELVGLLKEGGYKTLTVASDGASERLRVTLQKTIRERHLFEAAELVAAHQLKHLKVYMMVGVPGETAEDIDELIRFGQEISKVCNVALGIAPFVAKRNTPMDRLPFAGLKPVEKTLKRLQRSLRGKVDVRSTSARWAWVEWCMAQGGFDMADAAEQAWREGGSFQAWKAAIREHRVEAQPEDDQLRLGFPTGRFVKDLGYTEKRA